MNTASSSIGFEFTTTLTVTDNGSGTFGVYIGMGKLERDNQTTRFVTATPNNLITNISQAIHIYFKPSASIASGSMTIYNYILWKTFKI